MTSLEISSLSPPFPASCAGKGPFAAPSAGEDYFATEAHYLSLAARVVAALRRRAVFVILTGDPPPDPSLFSRSLEIAGAWWYAVIVIESEPDISPEQLLRKEPKLAASVRDHWGLQAAGPEPLLSPLFVFNTADEVSEDQVENIYQMLLHRERMRSAGVLLAQTASLAQLDRSKPRLIEDGLIARLHLQELGRDEIETFIRRQRSPDHPPNAFTTEAITAIADVSRGDPALVNHLARLTLEFAALTQTKKRDEPQIDPVEAVVETAVIDPVQQRAGTEAPLRSPVYRHRSARRTQVGLLLVLAIAGILAVPGDGFLSIAESAVRGLAAGVSDFGPWIKPSGDEASPAKPANASQLSAAIPPPFAERGEAGRRDRWALVAVTPDHPVSEPTDASSTTEPAALRSASPNDLAKVLPDPAPAAIAAPPVVSPSAALAPTDSQPSASMQRLAAQLHLSSEDIAALVARGDAFVVATDVSSARLLYERAAEAGDGRAALRMGATFDPAFLDQANMSSAFADQRQALSWYRRARDLGQAEAERRLNGSKPE
jgi:hypothetical protein